VKASSWMASSLRVLPATTSMCGAFFIVCELRHRRLQPCHALRR
jgi:hypothetical protein